MEASGDSCRRRAASCRSLTDQQSRGCSSIAVSLACCRGAGAALADLVKQEKYALYAYMVSHAKSFMAVCTRTSFSSSGVIKSSRSSRLATSFFGSGFVLKRFTSG